MTFPLLLKPQLERFFSKLLPQIRSYGVCSTARNVNTKVVNIEGLIVGRGASIRIKFTDSGIVDPESGNITLNVNNIGAKPIVFSDSNLATCDYTSGDLFCSNKVHSFTYDGTNWVLFNTNLGDIDALITESEFRNMT